MKRTLTIITLIATVASGWAQGIVDVRNGLVTFGTMADRLVRFPDNTAITGTNYIAQLYWTVGTVADDSVLSPMTAIPGGNAVVRFRPSNTTAPGVWIGGNRTLQSLPGQPLLPGTVLTLQVRAWDFFQGATFEEAAGRGLFGRSGLFSYTVPTPGDPPSAYYIENFRGFTLVPEPSVIILGALGALAFLLRRRKN